jgi:hypothetical protein
VDQAGEERAGENEIIKDCQWLKFGRELFLTIFDPAAASGFSWFQIFASKLIPAADI